MSENSNPNSRPATLPPPVARWATPVGGSWLAVLARAGFRQAADARDSSNRSNGNGNTDSRRTTR